MALSWNEIKDRALHFQREWAETSKEIADSQSFLIDFFNVFGISRKRVATFEHKVKKLDEREEYIDLLWKGTILIEMKSRGKNLEKAFRQARDYLYGLKEHELPKYILISDFENFILYDLEEESEIEFKLIDFMQHVHHFGFIPGYQKKIYKEQDPANLEAAGLLGKLHVRLKEIGYTGHSLEVYLIRILFCLFADDTTIFAKNQLQEYIEQRTNEDGSDLASKLQELFQVLNTPIENRFKNMDEQLAEFPYVNGKLFEENLPIASFDGKMRQSFLECGYIDWSKISPAIFGSMFQSVMNLQDRRNLGAHYTSESDILKLIKPLFLDELWKEFESIKDNKNKLSAFHKKLSSLTFLDPACGCGNFLVITYRELRLLELEILRTLYAKTKEIVLNIRDIIWLDIDQFYGIECEEFPARIAEVAMWLIDHQMNMQISNEFGQYFARLPLKKSANITHGNALQIEWSSLIKKQPIELTVQDSVLIINEPQIDYQILNIKTRNLTIIDDRKSISDRMIIKETFDYILGNPPFIGKKEQNHSQKTDLETIFKGVKGAGVLDYVTCWYSKAAQLIQNTKTKVAFVSTNSITQGEQAGILWNLLFNFYHLKIHFAHRTFKWHNEARGNAAVHCVIIGFANFDTNNKTIFAYDDTRGEAHEIKVKNINPYLVDGKDNFIVKRRKPICNVPEISFGSMPNDGGNFLLTDEERKKVIEQEPKIEKFIRPLLSAHEFLNGKKRWCLWLKDANPTELIEIKEVTRRVKNIKKLRAESKRITTKKLALFPTMFGEDRQPENDYILIPRVSSENRTIIPMGLFSSDYIVSDSCLSIQNANLFHFGMLQSQMHMVWVNYVGGRLKSDYRYSNEIVYNNFPWPANPTEKQINTIEENAQIVLEIRDNFPASSLADLYNPLTMPPALMKAHQKLDKAVDLAYRMQPFTSEANRMEFLFELYENYTADLYTKGKYKKK
jgi:hypothetical protein